MADCSPEAAKANTVNFKHFLLLFLPDRKSAENFTNQLPATIYWDMPLAKRSSFIATALRVEKMAESGCQEEAKSLALSGCSV